MSKIIRTEPGAILGRNACSGSRRTGASGFAARAATDASTRGSMSTGVRSM